PIGPRRSSVPVRPGSAGRATGADPGPRSRRPAFTAARVHRRPLSPPPAAFGAWGVRIDHETDAQARNLQVLIARRARPARSRPLRPFSTAVLSRTTARRANGGQPEPTR